MSFKMSCVCLIWIKVASALEGLENVSSSMVIITNFDPNQFDSGWPKFYT